MKLHTVGDSHSINGWPRVRVPGLQVSTHEIGPKLMYSFGRDGLDCCDIKKWGVKEGEIVCFCFGEIDCRRHVRKHGEYKPQIDAMVEKYLQAIKENVDRYENLTTWVYNVPPTAKSKHFKNPEFFLGSDDIRLTFVNYTNKKLAEACEEYGYTFVNVKDKYSNEDGFMNMSMSDGGVHVTDPRHLITFVKETLGI